MESVDAAAALNGKVPSWNNNAPLQISIQYRDLPPPEQPTDTVSQQRTSVSSGAGAARTGGSEKKVGPVGPWIPVMSRSRGRYYWFNKLTNQTTWDPPSPTAPASVTQPRAAKKVEEVEEDDEEEEEEYCDSEGYFGDEDRAELGRYGP